MLLGPSCEFPVVVCWLKICAVALEVCFCRRPLTRQLQFDTIIILYKFACSLQERLSLKSLETMLICLACCFAKYIVNNKNILLYAFIS